MNYDSERKEQIKQLKLKFAADLAQFPDHVKPELVSLLAFAINEAVSDEQLHCFDKSKVIAHITAQKGLMSYSSLNEEERLCVDIFAQQDITKQEHIVFYRRNYLDTLRISDDNAKRRETTKSTRQPCVRKGFISGFTSAVDKLRALAIPLVTMKTGAKHDK